MPNYVTAADKLTVTLQTITEDHFAPVDISAHFDRQTDALTKFTMSLMIPDATVIPCGDDTKTAAAVARVLAEWSQRLAQAAHAITKRFPTA